MSAVKRVLSAAAAGLLLISSAGCGKSSGKGAKTSITAEDSGQVIWNTKNIQVTFESYGGSDPLSPSIVLKAENKTAKDIYFFLNDLYINDYGIDAIMTESIPANGSGTAEIVIPDGSAAESGISDIGSISFRLMMENPEKSSFDNVYINSDEITITADKNVEQPEPDGELLYESGGIKIKALLPDDKNIGKHLLPLYIENSDSSKSVEVTLENLRLNGNEKTLPTPNKISLPAGKKAVTKMLVYDAYGGIPMTDARTTEVRFSIRKYDDRHEKSSDTGYLTIQGLTK